MNVNSTRDVEYMFKNMFLHAEPEINNEHVNDKNNIDPAVIPPPDSDSTKLPGKPKPLLKIAIANFCGLRKKSANLLAFCADASPDVLIGSESWLDSSIGTA